MRGSTIDAMADAVENAAVVLVCMSRDYKESSNCRFEGNYVTQQKKPYLCIMVEEGYSPKGWLGIMLGMNLWFGLYGDTLENEATFNSKVGEIIKSINYHLDKQGQPLAVTAAADTVKADVAASAAAGAGATGADVGSGGGNDSSALGESLQLNQRELLASATLGGGARAAHAAHAAAAASTTTTTTAALDSNGHAPYMPAASADVVGSLHVDVGKHLHICREQAKEELAWLQTSSGVSADKLSWYEKERKVLKLRGMYQDGIISATVLNETTAAILSANNFAAAAAASASATSAAVAAAAAAVIAIAVVAAAFILRTR